MKAWVNIQVIFMGLSLIPYEITRFSLKIVNTLLSDFSDNYKKAYIAERRIMAKELGEDPGPDEEE